MKNEIYENKTNLKVKTSLQILVFSWKLNKTKRDDSFSFWFGKDFIQRSASIPIMSQEVDLVQKKMKKLQHKES